jgi:MFS family permease
VRKLLALPGMRLFLLGDVLSALGDYSLWLAMGIWVKILTGSTSAAGLTFFVFALGSLLSPLAGVLVDRVRRKPLLIITHLTTAAMVLGLAFVDGEQDVWLIYLTMFLYGISGAITNTAQATLVPQLAPESMLAEANGLQQTLRQTLRLLTPAIGAGLLGWLGGGAVAILDAATFVAAAACLAFVRIDEDKPVAREQRWFAEVSAGFRFLGGTPVLRQLVVAIGAAMLVIGFFESLAYSVVTTGLGHAPTYVGVLVTMQGVGAILGGLTAAVVLNKTSEGMITLAALVLLTIGSLALVSGSDAVVLGGSIVFGVALPWAVTGAMTAFQRHTPLELLGRVRGAADIGVTGPQTGGIAIGAALIAAVPYQVLCYIAASVIGLAALYLGTRKEQRRTPVSELPDVAEVKQA